MKYVSVFVLVAVGFYSGFLYAEEPVSESPAKPSVIEKANQAVTDTSHQIARVLGETRSRREKSKLFVLATYSPLDLLLPNKYGLTLGLIENADKTWELEYLRGSISVPFIVRDLGEMTDQRISLIGRSYFGGNSFNLSYGLSYFDFSMHLGDQLLNDLSGGAYPSIEVIEIQSVGFNAGIGNRWSVDRNITIGFDWLSWSQPLFVIDKNTAYLDYATNPEDKDDVDKAVKIISYFPRLAFLKLQLGILF